MPLHPLVRTGIVGALLFGLVGAAQALTLHSDEFKEHRRPAVTFDHDEHNERAKLDDNCAVCHHGGENGVLDSEDTSEGTPCSACHKVVAEPGRTPLMRAYHKNCIACHTERNLGPTTCGGCHK